MINTKRIILMAALFIISLPVLSQAQTVNLPKTGQTTIYDTGDDGDLQKGVAWPPPRFTDNGDGTITDNLTGLIWLTDANCFGTRIWTDAISDANALADGACGLTDGSLAGDWRLPNVNELESLVNAEEASQATWLNDPAQGFTNVQSNYYWSSTTFASNAFRAWFVDMWYGYVDSYNKTLYYYVWPVRAGQ